MLLTIVLITVLLTSVQSMAWAIGLRQRTNTALRIRIAFVNKMWNVYLCLCFFFFPPVSTTLWKTLRCIELSPGNWALWADLSITCYDAFVMRTQTRP